jgi:predicted ATPase with chaperone activity
MRITRSEDGRKSIVNAGILSIISCCSGSGAGKSMLAHRSTTILPMMTLAEAVKTTRLHRVAG